ncbi:MAG TPA: methyltransferase domain-containing protein [Thermoanaerobaculia bacterium]|jgi:SAM-dependent methyltransferase|nr:methyltransferase domain-containing protein [Thermoanaerobaculia bacterium]
MTGRDRFHAIPGTYYVSECTSCGLWFQNPRPDANSIPDLYPLDYSPHQDPPASVLTDSDRWVLHHDFGYKHLAVAQTRPNAFRRWLGRWHANNDLQPRFVEGGLLVEIGSANGARLGRLRELGWMRLEGIEIAAAAAEEARHRGFTVHNAPVEEGIERYKDNSIDTIIASMLIEHLLNPFVVLERFAAKLKPGAELLFSTMVRDRIDARIWKTYWKSLELPRHMVWFRLDDVRRMLDRSFERVQIHHQAEPVDFTGSARLRAVEQKHVLDRVLMAIGDRALKYPVIALSLLGQTSRIVVRAVKR